MSYSHPPSELIQQRFSCRTYVNEPIASELRSLLAEYVAAQTKGPLGGRARFGLVAAVEDDFQALKGLGTYGFIRGATGYLVGATPAAEDKMEDFGYLMERIILYATDLGLGTCWLGGTFTKTSFAGKIDVRPGELVPAVTAVGYINKKPGRLDRLVRRGAKAEPDSGEGHRRKPWEKLFFDGAWGEPLLPHACEDYAAALEMVRLGPSASNRQPWRILREGGRFHFYLQRTPGYREGRLNRMMVVADLQRMDLGIAMCHFELAAKEAGLDGRWEAAPPGRVELNDEGIEYTASWIPL